MYLKNYKSTNTFWNQVIFKYLKIWDIHNYEKTGVEQSWRPMFDLFGKVGAPKMNMIEHYFGGFQTICVNDRLE